MSTQSRNVPSATRVRDRKLGQPLDRKVLTLRTVPVTRNHPIHVARQAAGFRSTPPPSVKPPNATSSKSSVATRAAHHPVSSDFASNPLTEIAASLNIVRPSYADDLYATLEDRYALATSDELHIGIHRA